VVSSSTTCRWQTEVDDAASAQPGIVARSSSAIRERGKAARHHWMAYSDSATTYMEVTGV
jgi:hypothetical protein